jgi:tRNA-dihydrouridine synthase A
MIAEHVHGGTNDLVTEPISRVFCVAPMLDWTDRHCRYFHRLISRRALLYTEMITTGALIHGDRDRFLTLNEEEHPVALQLGGSNPNDLSICTMMAEDYGYNEVNLNIGCPSDRVQNGRFGACLMAEPERVAECITAMKRSVSIPVTVKSRIGIDDQDSYLELAHFIATLADAGCKTFIIHARKAWLNGLSPKQNRDIPPLRYEMVYQIKQDFPDLELILNGGINTLDQGKAMLNFVDGVMLGREVYHRPFLLAKVDEVFFQNPSYDKSRTKIALQLIPYIQKQLKAGVRLNSITRHILGLFHGQPGAKCWRRHISENAYKSGADENVVLSALKFVQ